MKLIRRTLFALVLVFVSGAQSESIFTSGECISLVPFWNIWLSTCVRSNPIPTPSRRNSDPHSAGCLIEMFHNCRGRIPVLRFIVVAAERLPVVRYNVQL